VCMWLFLLLWYTSSVSLPCPCLPPSQKEVRRRYSGTVICATTPKDGNPDANDVYWMSVLVIHAHPGITTMEQAVEFGNTPIWLKGRLCASNPTKADLRVVLFEYLRRPVAAWHFESKAIISKIFINRICVLLNCGAQVRDGRNQGQWVMESYDAQGLLYNDKLFKNVKCKDACLMALHGWLEWGLYLDKFYTSSTEVNGEGTYKVYMHMYAFVMAKVRSNCVLCLVRRVERRARHYVVFSCGFLSLTVDLVAALLLLHGFFLRGCVAQVYLTLRRIAKHKPFTASAGNVDGGFRKVHACVVILMDRYLPRTGEAEEGLQLLDGTDPNRGITSGLPESDLTETMEQIDAARLTPVADQGGDEGSGGGHAEGGGGGWADLDEDGLQLPTWDLEEETHDEDGDEQ